MCSFVQMCLFKQKTLSRPQVGWFYLRHFVSMFFSKCGGAMRMILSADLRNSNQTMALCFFTVFLVASFIGVYVI